jgi:hypothetical protein
MNGFLSHYFVHNHFDKNLPLADSRQFVVKITGLPQMWRRHSCLRNQADRSVCPTVLKLFSDLLGCPSSVSGCKNHFPACAFGQTGVFAPHSSKKPLD